MTKQVQRRRGTATQHTSFTGADGEISVNTTNKTIHVHDGTTTGGFEAARIDLTNVTGATVAGKVTGSTLSSLTITSADINGGTIDNTAIGNTTPSSGRFTTLEASSTLTLGGTAVTSTAAELNYNDITTLGTVQASKTVTANASGDVLFPDGDKAIFGAGSDLSIYHSGSQSIIEEVGTGNLVIRAGDLYVNNAAGTENMIHAVNDGAVKLYYDNALKISTTATGIDVTGAVVADGLTVDGGNTIRLNAASGDDFLTIDQGAADATITANSAAGNANLVLSTTASGAVKERVDIAYNGDISFYEDTGTTAKFFWDASAESLGIGTTSPSQKLHVAGNIVLNAAGFVGFGGGTNYIEGSATNLLKFGTANVERMRIDSSGNVGIGTALPASTLHLQAAANADTTLTVTGGVAAGLGSNAIIKLIPDGTAGAGIINIDGSDGSDVFQIKQSNATRLIIDSSGSVGIGTTSLATGYRLTLSGTAGANDIGLAIADTSGKTFAFYSSGNKLFFRDVTAAATRLIIDSSGNFGIGTSSPSSQIHAENSAGSCGIRVISSTTGTSSINLGDTGDNNDGSIEYNNSSRYMMFQVADAERMRIDSSGNVIVGKGGGTSNASQGVLISQTGEINAHKDSSHVLLIDRGTDDGTLVLLRRDGSTVGSIGSEGSNSLILQGGTTGGAGLHYHGNSFSIVPARNSARIDNVIDLGTGTYRFDDIYATNGTIQTSDRNEKQDIDVMSEAETRVAVACKGLMRKFRWKDAVAEKGDDARIHFGIIAQDLQDAFAAEGLDAGRYAMFISRTWWEADRVVPAVEAVDDTEAVAEHTVTDHYDTLEEAPKGATERTRLGVRYPELLAFIIGAL